MKEMPEDFDAFMTRLKFINIRIVSRSKYAASVTINCCRARLEIPQIRPSFANTLGAVFPNCLSKL